MGRSPEKAWFSMAWRREPLILANHRRHPRPGQLACVQETVTPIRDGVVASDIRDLVAHCGKSLPSDKDDRSIELSESESDFCYTRSVIDSDLTRPKRCDLSFRRRDAAWSLIVACSTCAAAARPSTKATVS